MNCDRVVIRKVRYGYDVEADGRVASCLCWDEMLAQLISLTHAEISSPRFRTLTAEEEIADDIRRNTEKPPTADDFVEASTRPMPALKPLPREIPDANYDPENDPEMKGPKIVFAPSPECDKDTLCTRMNGHAGECELDIPF